MTHDTGNDADDEHDYDAVLSTHRRSGTHLMLEYLEGQLGLRMRKSHAFPNPLVSAVPTVHLVRNPVDVLWSTYRWFVRGGSSNSLITEALAGIGFDAYLRGDGGPLLGYTAMRMKARDSLDDGRGMFYDPIRFWVDHVRAFADGSGTSLCIRYEALVDDPTTQIRRVGHYLGVPMPAAFRTIDRSERVGHSPSPADAPPAIDQWGDDSLRRLVDTAGDVLEQFGYSVPERTPRAPLPTPRRERAVVRYVSRDDNSGYAVAARRSIDALAGAGVDVVWEPQPHEQHSRSAPSAEAPATLVERYRPNTASDITVMHTMPEWWPSLRHSFGRGHYVGHTVWELEQYPESWHHSVFAADELWVPTEWNRRTFHRGGVRQPVHVLPHVVSRDLVAPPPVDLPNDVTVFTTVSSWHPRKRPDWVVEAFARAFKKGDPVLLVVKTAPWTDAWPVDDELQKMTWWQVMQVLRRHDRPPDVMLVNDDFTDAEVNGLVSRADCYVSLACSEGWGLGMFDAAVLGTPVITTGFGGHLAYLGADHPGLVPYAMAPVDGVQNAPHFQHGMQWAAPNLDAAAAMMRAIVDGTSPLPAAAPALAARLRAKYSPEVVGAAALAMLEQHA